MKSFVAKVLMFLASLIGIVMFLILSSSFLANKYSNLEVPKSYNTIIIGDSSTQHALDDAIIDSCYNISESGISNFYTYVKLRSLLEHNLHLERVVLCYSYDNLSFENQKLFSNDKSIKFKFSKYFYLMSNSEIVRLVKMNYQAFITSIPKVISHNLSVLTNEKHALKSMGRYAHLNRDMLEASFMRFEKLKSKTGKKARYSEIQKEYVKEIYNICLQNNIELILFAPPKHKHFRPLWKKFEDTHVEFKKRHMPAAKFLDMHEFHMADSCYADIHHVNIKGARIISKYINENGFDNIGVYIDSPNNPDPN